MNEYKIGLKSRKSKKAENINTIPLQVHKTTPLQRLYNFKIPLCSLVFYKTLTIFIQTCIPY